MTYTVYLLYNLHRSTKSDQEKEANHEYEEIQPYSLGTDQSTPYVNQ